jgi:hypothetical protein
MKKPTELVRDDIYEELGSSYQCLQVSLLDRALQESGVMDAVVRQKVCESFLFSLGELHDHGWLRSSPEVEPLYPLLCFSEKFLNVNSSVEELGSVYVPSEGFSFHEYAHGNASLLFEGDPNAHIETGHFAGENDPE